MCQQKLSFFFTSQLGAKNCHVQGAQIKQKPFNCLSFISTQFFCFLTFICFLRQYHVCNYCFSLATFSFKNFLLRFKNILNNFKTCGVKKTCKSKLLVPQSSKEEFLLKLSFEFDIVVIFRILTDPLVLKIYV